MAADANRLFSNSFLAPPLVHSLLYLVLFFFLLFLISNPFHLLLLPAGFSGRLVSPVLIKW